MEWKHKEHYVQCQSHVYRTTINETEEKNYVGLFKNTDEKEKENNTGNCKAFCVNKTYKIVQKVQNFVKQTSISSRYL